LRRRSACCAATETGGEEGANRPGQAQRDTLVHYNHTHKVIPRVDSVSAGQDSDTYHLVAGDAAGSHADEVLLQLSKAITEHSNAVNDQARILVAPLAREESLWMVDMYEHVAAYLVMPLSDFLCGSESALLEKLAVRLSVVPLERVDYDIVWGKKRTLALYVSAKLAT
jgi:hypothetical protein